MLEEKLSVILAEMGVDKYSDVLDSEVAECDFTDAYMNTIAKPYKLEESLKPIESEMRQQLKNSNQYKEIIREEKDLQELVGQESDFDRCRCCTEIDACLLQWLAGTGVYAD